MKDSLITVLHAGLYPAHRNTALGVKAGDPDAVAEAASLLEALLPKAPVTLIPIPSHNGFPEGNMAVATAIAALHPQGTYIISDLRSLPHASRHDAKHGGTDPATLPAPRMDLARGETTLINIAWCRDHGYTPFLLDDVADTGATLREAAYMTGATDALVLDVTLRFFNDTIHD